MFRKFLATTAIATVIASGAIAQTAAPAPAPAEPMAQDQMATETVARADGHLASNIIGETVYNSAADDAENIGTVNDIVLNADGAAEMVVVGVGGFLGLGQKNVALPYDEIEWAERDGDRWIIIARTSEQLQEMAEFDNRAYEPAATGDGVAMTNEPAVAPAPADTAVAPAPAETGVATDQTAPAAPAPMAQTDATAPAATDETQTSAIDRSTLQSLDTASISADEFIGTTVYGANDENIGSISDVIVSDSGVDAVIVDVGGFLGIGSKSVAIGMDNLQFMTDGNDNTYLYTEFTQEQLEAQPEYDEATFADNRDEMLLVVPN